MDIDFTSEKLASGENLLFYLRILRFCGLSKLGLLSIINSSVYKELNLRFNLFFKIIHYILSIGFTKDVINIKYHHSRHM